MPVFTRKHMITSQRIYEGAVINLRVDELESKEGRVTRAVVEHNGGVVIICQPEPRKLVLVKQYRYTLDQELVELPAGRIDLGESALLAAQRELVEETGYQASKWKQVATLSSAPGFCDELLYVFTASKVSQVGKKLDHDEETDVLVLSLKEAWQLLTSSKIVDAKSLAALSLLNSAKFSNLLV